MWNATILARASQHGRS